MILSRLLRLAWACSVPQCASGTITLTTGGIGTTFTVSGLPFQPKAIFFAHSGRAAVGQAEGTHRFGAGFAVSTSSRRCYSSFSDHAQATMTNGIVALNDCVVGAQNNVLGMAGKADLDAVLSDGFRLIIDQVFAVAMIVGWEAWGGDLTDAQIVDFTDPGAPGNLDVATSFSLNTGKDDKAVIFLGINGTGFGTPGGDSCWFIGAAAGHSIVNAVLGGMSDNGLADAITCSYCRLGECVALVDPDVVNRRASVTAWDPAGNGFRLNFAEVGGGGVSYSALVLKGGRWFIGSGLTATDGSNVVEATPYVPKGILVASHNKAENASDVTAPHDERSVGVADAVGQWYASMIDKDAAAAADVGVDFNTTGFYGNQSTAATIVVEGVGGLVSLDATPGFTFAMSDPDPVASFFWYLGWADGVAPSDGRPWLNPLRMAPQQRFQAAF